MRFFVPATLWLLTAGTSIGSAQAPPPTGPALPPVFESLQDGQWVRVTLAGEGRREGRVTERSPASLILSTEPEPTRVPVAALDTLWTRRSNVKTGAIIGALLGAGMGAVAAASLGESDADRNAVWAFSLGAGTVGGGLLGALFGATLPGWRQRYPGK